METRTLGRTHLQVGRLGMAASFGVPATAVERAFERGVNYLYWGTFRRGPFGQALRNLKPQRDRMVLVLQSYSRMAALLAPSVEIALRKLNFEYADVLLLGLWNNKPPARILKASISCASADWCVTSLFPRTSGPSSPSSMLILASESCTCATTPSTKEPKARYFHCSHRMELVLELSPSLPPVGASC